MKFPTITMDFQVIAGHRLMASKGLCHYVHGHNYLFRLTLARRNTREPLSDEGMVADFDSVRSALKPVLDSMDHAFFVQDTDMLYVGRKAFQCSDAEGDYTVEGMFKFYPMGAPPTAEHLAYLFYMQAGAYLPAELEIVKVTCVEAPGCEATYSSL